jgi:hypothetical protein
MMNKCIVCEGEIIFDECKSIDESRTVSLIHDAVICSTTGNYGSKVLDLCVWPDSERDRWLEFYICDKCVILKRDYFTLINLITRGKDTYERIPWGPDYDEI